MEFKKILNSFSSRRKRQKDKNKEVSINAQTRTRILMILRDSMNKQNYAAFSRSLLETRQMLMFKIGGSLIKNFNDETSEVLSFLNNCQAEIFLDFLEYVFETEQMKNINENFKNRIVDDVNSVLEYDNVPYQLTAYIEEYTESPDNALFLIKNIISQPQVIEKDDDFTYSELIKPALDLLKDARFSNVNKEFLEALDHYKNKRYKECITSCCSSLESTIKVIMNIKHWKYDSKFTLNKLVEYISKEANIPTWYSNVLISPGTIRNNIGLSHGRGEQTIIATKNEARYQINITASEIIFLIEQAL